MQISYKFRNNAMFYANPIVKLTFILSFFVLSFIYDNPFYLGCILITILAFSAFAKILHSMWTILKFSAAWSILFFIVTLLSNHNGNTILIDLPTEICLIGNLHITLETIIYALISIFRFNIVVLIFSFMNFTVDPDDIMRIFIRMRLPYAIVLIFTLTLRFFPLLLQDLSLIGEVQQARGYELDRGGFWIRLKRRMSLILPLLSNSLERSIQASESLEARGFDTKIKRIPYKTLVISNGDSIQIFFWVLATVTLIYLRTLGYGLFIIYPVVLINPINWIDILIFGIWAVFSAAFLLSLKWRHINP